MDKVCHRQLTFKGDSLTPTSSSHCFLVYQHNVIDHFIVISQEYKWAETGKGQRKLNVLASLHMGALVIMKLNKKELGVELMPVIPTLGRLSS